MDGGVTRTIMDVLSWGELLVASLQQERVPGTVQAEDVLCVCVWGAFVCVTLCGDEHVHTFQRPKGITVMLHKTP